jgi:hypothetical protein
VNQKDPPLGADAKNGAFFRGGGPPRATRPWPAAHSPALSASDAPGPQTTPAYLTALPLAFTPYQYPPEAKTPM